MKIEEFIKKIKNSKNSLKLKVFWGNKGKSRYDYNKNQKKSFYNQL